MKNQTFLVRATHAFVLLACNYIIFGIKSACLIGLKYVKRRCRLAGAFAQANLHLIFFLYSSCCMTIHLIHL